MTTPVGDRVSSSGPEPPVPPGTPNRAGRRRLVLLLTLALVVGAGGLGVAGLLTDHVVRTRYVANLERFPDPTVSRPEASRPAPVVTEAGTARNFLLLGSDSRISAGDASEWQAGAQRTDAIMVAHVPADGSQVVVVSIPRDTWVPVPGHGRAKINAAFSYGGPPLLVETVEDLTGLRIDHVAVVDFEGFEQMTDALGGVTITVPETTSDLRGTFEAGTHRMGGEDALRYVRQRYGLDGGDFDRVKRQQNWIRAVAVEALGRDTLASPSTLDAFLRATTSSIALDEGFGATELTDLALQLRGVRAEDLHFVTVPVAGTGRSEDGQSIVHLDDVAADGLWAAIRADDVDRWVADADTLGDVVE